MTNSFMYNDKPLAFWMVQMLSEQDDQRQAAAQALDAIIGMDTEPFNEAVREIVQNEWLASYGLSSAEYVNRLLAMHVFLSDLWMEHMNDERRESDAFIDDWIVRHGDAPEKLHQLMRRMCIRAARKERNQPFDFMPGTCVLITVTALGKEFLPVSDLLRWMLHDDKHRGIADMIVREMKNAGEIFFDDYLEIARKDSCALHNYSYHIGDMVRHSPEKMERLLRLVDDPDPQMSLFAVAALGSCGPEAERLIPGVENRLMQLSDESFNKLYGDHPVSVNDRKRRNALYDIFVCSTTSLGAVAASKTALRYFLKLLDKDVPKEPLKGTYSVETNKYDWEFAVAPIHLVRGTLISSLRYFASFPEIVVPRLIPLLTEFEEYDGDTYQHARVLDALAVFANYGPEEAKQESGRYDYNSDEREYLFSNRFEHYFDGLPEVLENLLWDQPDPDNEDQESQLNDRIVQMLGRLGRVSRAQLPRLEDAKAVLLKRYGKEYFEFDEDESEPSLFAAIRRIQGDR